MFCVCFILLSSVQKDMDLLFSSSTEGRLHEPETYLIVSAQNNTFACESNWGRRLSYVPIDGKQAWILDFVSLPREKGHIFGLSDKLDWLQSDFHVLFCFFQNSLPRCFNISLCVVASHLHHQVEDEASFPVLFYFTYVLIFLIFFFMFLFFPSRSQFRDLAAH